MKRFLISTAAHLVGNAIGLLLASFLLAGFSIAPLALLIVVVVFTAVEVIAAPILRNVSQNNLPSLMGGIALVTTFVGLMVTGLLVDGFTIGGISNLLAATLLVWLGALIAGVLLSKYVFTSLQDGN